MESVWVLWVLQIGYFKEGEYMRNFAKMSIDELQELLSGVTVPSSSSPTEAVLQSKTIMFLSNEIAVFKEALTNNISTLNNTIGITNKSVKELRDSIEVSTDKIIDSNKQLAKSQNRNSTIITILTFALVVVGVCQAIVMNKQSKIMDKQAEIMKWQLSNNIPEGHAKPVF
jgi:hypothetical protein